MELSNKALCESERERVVGGGGERKKRRARWRRRGE